MSTTLCVSGNCSGASQAPVAPVVPTRGPIPEAIDSALSDLARAASRRDPVIRNTLYAAYAPVLDRIGRRIWWTMARKDLVDPGDVQNEGFLVFCALLDNWSGDGSFTRYLLARFSWRLRDRVMRANGRRPPASVIDSLALAAFDSWEAERAMALLAELVEPLSEFDRRLVLARVVDCRSIRAIASQLGVSASTAESRWATLRLELYRNLQLLVNNFE